MLRRAPAPTFRPRSIAGDRYCPSLLKTWLQSQLLENRSRTPERPGSARRRPRRGGREDGQAGTQNLKIRPAAIPDAIAAQHPPARARYAKPRRRAYGYSTHKTVWSRSTKAGLRKCFQLPKQWLSGCSVSSRSLLQEQRIRRKKSRSDACRTGIAIATRSAIRT